jgi:hypothetical protein
VTEGSVNLFHTTARAAAAAPVQSVNNKTGVISLVASDVGAAASSHKHALADISQSSATSGQVPTWNGTAWAPATPSAGGGGSANIVEAATAAGFPATGASQTLYHATDVRRIYFWDAAGGVYVEAGPSGGGSGGDGTDAALRALFVPAAPTSVTVTGGNAQATVSWTAPTVLPQTPITNYSVQFSSTGGPPWMGSFLTGSTSTSQVVTGLTNGTPYVFRVAAVNGVGTGVYSSVTSAVTPVAVVASDPYFSNVALLLHMDGSFNTFVDSSPAPKTQALISYQVTQSTTQSRFGGKSAYFDGNQGFLEFPAEASISGTEDFVIEMWVFPTRFSSQNFFIGINSFSGAEHGAFILGHSGSGSILAGNTAQGLFIGAGATGYPLQANEWTYLAISRSGNIFRAYINGIMVDVVNNSISFTARSQYLGGNNGDSYFAGYIDEFRVTRGSNRDYNSMTIPVPTAAFPNS